jgi:ribose transport system ATP-binding protein
MKILSGVYELDSGAITFKGQPAAFRNPRQSQLAGITTIYQELNQVPYLSVTENIFLGSEMTRGGVALKWSEMHREARALLAKLHLEIDPRTHVGELGVGMQQMVEVAKALYHKADLIIMDEPTSSLSIREIRDLFSIVRELKAEGVSVIYISHHLEEIFQISDRTTVLRDGRHISTQPTSTLDVDKLIRLMVVNGAIMLLGERSTEMWAATGPGGPATRHDRRRRARARKDAATGLAATGCELSRPGGRLSDRQGAGLVSPWQWFCLRRGIRRS